MVDRVFNYIKSLSINKNEFVVVACSGGPDSMFLLEILYEMGFSCVVAHVNHNMREASASEYIFLEEYCQKKDIPFEGTKINSYSKVNFHQDAREFRYQFFENILKKYNSHYLFTAHHGDDLTETILMRIVRGASLKGYKGFDLLTQKCGYCIVRPLVFLTKQFIEEENKKREIPYVIDESNLEDHYTRNRFRHHVLPFLKEEDKNVHLKFLQFNNTLRDCTQFLEKIVAKELNIVYDNNVLLLEPFVLLDPFIQKQIVIQILNEMYPTNLYLVRNAHVDEIMKMITSEKPNLEHVLPQNLCVRKEYNLLRFIFDQKKNEEYQYIFDKIQKTPLGIIKAMEKSDDQSNFVIRLNSRDITLPIIIRSRRNGDFIEIKNMNGTKKVKSVFIDHKVIFNNRDEWPIVTDSKGVVLWIPGLTKSKFDVSIHGLYDIILKYEKGEETDE